MLSLCLISVRSLCSMYSVMCIPSQRQRHDKRLKGGNGKKSFFFSLSLSSFFFLVLKVKESRLDTQYDEEWQEMTTTVIVSPSQSNTEKNSAPKNAPSRLLEWQEEIATACALHIEKADVYGTNNCNAKCRMQHLSSCASKYRLRISNDWLWTLGGEAFPS